MEKKKKKNQKILVQLVQLVIKMKEKALMLN